MGTAIYTRVSTDEQVKGFGLQVQRDKCIKTAAAKDLEITHEYTDEGISGTLGEKHRSGLAALMAAIDAGEVKTLIVPSMDRLARSATMLLILKQKLDDADIAFISCKESIDTSTPMGIAMMQMVAVFAELDKNIVVERLQDGKRARRNKDGEQGGPLPLGYLRIDGQIAVEPDEAAIVRQIFELRQQGLILQAIADTLNTQDIKSKQGGKKWYPSSVRQILIAEDKYRGGFRCKSPVYWPAILEG